MTSIAAIALSGLQTAQLRLQASANNIANMGTAGYAPQRVVSSSQPDGGVQAVIETGAPDSGDLVTDIVEQLSAGYAFKANALSLRRADQLYGTLLDVRV